MKRGANNPTCCASIWNGRAWRLCGAGAKQHGALAPRCAFHASLPAGYYACALFALARQGNQLNDWERQFLRNLPNHAALSAKQRSAAIAIFDRLRLAHVDL